MERMINQVKGQSAEGWARARAEAENWRKVEDTGEIDDRYM